MQKNNFHIELNRCSLAMIFLLIFLSLSWVTTQYLGTYQILSERNLLPGQLEQEIALEGVQVRRQALAFAPFAFLVRLEIHVVDRKKSSPEEASSGTVPFEGVFVENYFWFFGFYERFDSARELAQV